MFFEEGDLTWVILKNEITISFFSFFYPLLFSSSYFISSIKAYDRYYERSKII